MKSQQTQRMSVSQQSTWFLKSSILLVPNYIQYLGKNWLFMHVYQHLCTAACDYFTLTALDVSVVVTLWFESSKTKAKLYFFFLLNIETQWNGKKLIGHILFFIIVRTKVKANETVKIWCNWKQCFNMLLLLLMMTGLISTDQPFSSVLFYRGFENVVVRVVIACARVVVVVVFVNDFLNDVNRDENISILKKKHIQIIE